MLLPGLKRHPAGGISVPVERHPYYPSRHLSLEPAQGGEVRGVGPPVADWHPESLRGSDDGVGSKLPGGNEKREAHEVRGEGDFHPGSARALHELRAVPHFAEGVGILNQGSEKAFVDLRVVLVALDQGYSERPGAGRQHVGGLGKAPAGDEKARGRAFSPLPASEPEKHGHRLGRGGRLVQQRGVCEFHAREFRDHGLEVQKRLEAPLGDFRLVGGVLRVPAGVLQDVSRYDGGNHAAVVAEPYVGAERPVSAGDLPHVGEIAAFGHRGGKIEIALEEQVRGNGFPHEAAHRVRPYLGEHGVPLPRGGANVPRREKILPFVNSAVSFQSGLQKKPPGHGRRKRVSRPPLLPRAFRNRRAREVLPFRPGQVPRSVSSLSTRHRTGRRSQVRGNPRGCR